LLLVLPLLVEALQQARARRDTSRQVRAAVVSIASVLATPTGFVLYLWFWESKGGDFLLPFKMQGEFGREFAWPWQTLSDAFVLASQYVGIYPGGYHIADALLVILGLAGAAWVTLRTRLMYGVYTWISLLFPLFMPYDGRPLMSVPRFMVVVFPVFWAFVALGESWRLTQAVVVMSATGLGIFSALYVTWYWIL
jgi:hypothetical protein